MWCHWAWAPAGIFPEGAKSRGLAKMTHFRRAAGANENFRDFFRRFRLNYGIWIFDASAKGTSENFRAFCTETADMTSSFSNSGLGALPQLPPLRAPMPLGDTKTEELISQFTMGVSTVREGTDSLPPLPWNQQ